MGLGGLFSFGILLFIFLELSFFFYLFGDLDLSATDAWTVIVEAVACQIFFLGELC